MLRRTSLLALVIPLAAATAPPRPVRVVTVAMQQREAALSFSGVVQARIEADLAFRVAGKVTQRLVEIGDHVRAGQSLAVLDPADLQFSQEAAEAALQAAQADAANAVTDLRRYDRLGRSSPAYLPSEYDKRIAAQRIAQARLAQAERQAALARDQRSYGVLTADANGVVTAMPVEVGQVVASGQTVARLAHTSETEVAVDIPENRLADIRTARRVTISLWAAPGLVLRGRVREIGALADPASRTFTVKVTVLDPPADLLALGMTATVTFGREGEPTALLPAGALTDLAGKPAVWVFDPAQKRAALRPIDVAGYTGDGAVLVRGGVASGEQVVTAGVPELVSGMDLTMWAGPSR